MKKLPKFITIALISFIISLFIFSSIMLYLFLPNNSKEITVEKTDASVPYSPPYELKEFTVLISIDNCPINFQAIFSLKNKNIVLSCLPKNSVNSSNEEIKAPSDKTIAFTLSGFKNTVNFINGIEIETPYGLPAPAGTGAIIAQDEKLNVYGASICTMFTAEKQPSVEKQAYYCYVMGELCFKFIKECTTESYKTLNQSSKTNISYTEFYDNFKSLKNGITNVVCSSTEGYWKDDLFYLG